MAKFCQNCGSPLEGAGKFCPSCGAQIMDAAQEQAAPQEMEKPSAPPQPVMNQMEQPSVPPQPIMNQNMQGQKPGQQPYGAWPGQGPAQQAYGAAGAAGAAMFGGGAYVPDEGIAQMFFRYDNRLNRKRYIMRALALVAAVTLATIVLSIVFVVVGMDESMIGTMGLLIGLLGAIPGFMLVIRRLHDLDRPTWWIIGKFIPFINIALALYLILCKGTEGPNQYGPDPLEGQP